MRYLIHAILFLTGLTLPMEQLAVVWAVLPITPAKVASFLLLNLAIVHQFLYGRTVTRDPKAKWVLLLLISYAASTFYSSWQGMDGLLLMLGTVKWVSILIFYFLLRQVIRTRSELDTLLAGFVVGAAITGLSAIVTPDQGLFVYERKSGIGGFANQNAANMLVALTAAYALFSSSRSFLWKAVLVGCALTQGTAILIAASRSAFIGMVGMAGLWMSRFRRIEDLRFVVVGIVLVAMAFIYAPQAYVERLETLGAVAEGRGAGIDVSRRIHRETVALEAFASSPIVGVGHLRFGDWAQLHGKRLARTVKVHNSPLQVASEQGLLGLIPFFMVFLLTWVDLSRAQRLGRRNRGDPELQELRLRATLLQIGYVGILVVSMFQPGALWKGMWLMAGMSTVMLSLARQRAQALGPDVDPVRSVEGFARAVV